MANIIQTFPTGAGGGDTIQVDTMPTASIDELGKIYQYVGEHGIHIDFADNAVNNFVGEGNTYFYSIANNNIQLKGHNTGAGIVKCTQPLTNRGTIQITKTYNGVATNIFTNKTRIGTTVGGNDVYESPDWGRASSVETIDLSQFAEETLYISFRVEVTQINSGQVDVYTISSVLYDAADIHTNGYFYKCKSKDEEGTTVYYWDEIPVQEIPPSNESISLENFNALTQEEKDNGTAYYIYDAEAMSNFTVMGNRFDKANIYTEDERMIGSYLGKPLYQRTYEFNTTVEISSTSWTAVGVSSDGIGIVINAYGCGRAVEEDGRFGYLNAAKISGEVKFLACRDANTIEFHYITIQYTKTTDGIVNIGTGNDYSTEEQIIGTWIDGKPLYQKTVDCGQKTITSTLAIICTISDVDTPVSVSILRTEGSYKDVLDGDKDWRKVFRNNGDVCLSQSVQQSYSDGSYIAKLQYTKTTD